MIAAACAGHFPWRMTGLAASLFPLLVLQSLFIIPYAYPNDIPVLGTMPWLSSLHVLNALIHLFGLHFSGRCGHAATLPRCPVSRDLEHLSLARLRHVLSILVLLLCHGAAFTVTYVLRQERRPERIGVLLDLSLASFDSRRALGRIFWIDFLVVVASGVALMIAGGWWHSWCP